MRYGMVIDLSRCIGCSSCTVACKAENRTPSGVSFIKVIINESGTYPNVKLTFLPVSCMHCKNAPCLSACPTGATYRRNDGVIALDTEKCLGCRACMQACPYQARSFVWGQSYYYDSQAGTPFEAKAKEKYETGTTAKCTFCAHRLERGMKPACVKTCIAQARFFGDLDDPESEVAKLIGRYNGQPLKADLGTQPSVYFIKG